MNDVTNAARAGGSRMTVLGVIAIILGMFALIAPGLTGLSVAMLLGFIVLAGGIVRFISAFHAGSLGRGVFQFIVGVLTVLCGGALIANPLFAAEVLTILLAIYFILDGIIELTAGFKMQPASGWLIFGGIVSLLLGAMIWSQFPLSGPWAMGILLGIKLFFVGLIMVTGGQSVRSAAGKPA